MNRDNDARKRILIVDDHPMFRRGLIQSVQAEPGLEVCGEAANAEEALKAVSALQPDLVMLDVTLPGRSGLELLPEILEARPGTLVLVVSMHDEFLYAERAIRLGARGYMMKHEDPAKLMDTIRKVLNGEVCLSSTASSAILQNLSGRRSAASKFAVDRLSEREYEVFQMLGRGLTTNEIGQKLELNVRTVVVHCSNIRRKLGITTTAELTACAVRYVNS